MVKSIPVRIPKILASKVDKIASRTKRPRSYITQKTVECCVDEYADLKTALDRLHDKTDPIVSEKDLRKSLGL